MHQPLDILQQYWQYDSFRPLQEDIIQSVLDGRDTLALMPTGGGKSICFQVPTLCHEEGVCIVVSPLIALMKDQVRQLRERGITAEAIFSGMHFRDIDRILDNCVHGDVRFLYLSPERLVTELAIERIKRMNVVLLAVDEAHCISQWGYDFRPPYRQIADIRQWMPKVPVLAVTATATAEVVRDIQTQLAFGKPNVLSKSFGRDNLTYVVLEQEKKAGKMLDIFKKVPGSGLVYVRSRKATRQVAAFLQRRGLSADYYHAGLDAAERSRKQDEWIAGKTRIIACTNAFGMGIDKPDVRVVVHLELPDSLEAYYQEAGRAGRDGKRSYAALLYNDRDRLRLEQQYEQAFPDITDIKRVYQALGNYLQLANGGGKEQSFDFEITAFVKTYDLDLLVTFNALKILEQSGWLMMTEAVYLPSQIKFLVDKEMLYDFQLKNKAFDPVIRALLRTAQGAFSDFVRIREDQISRFLHLSGNRLRKALALLHKDRILEYRPAKDQPQITLLHERVSPEDLTIDRQLYNFRKNRHLERIRQAVAYASVPECRSRQLLAYFGETDSENCGKCDVCQGRHDKKITAADKNRYREKINDLITKDRLTVAQVSDSFSSRHRDLVLRVLQQMQDENEVMVDDKGRLVMPAT